MSSLIPSAYRGWVLAGLLCLSAWLGLGPLAYAGTFNPSQTTFPALAVGQISAPVLVTLTAQSSGTVVSPTVVTEGTSASSLAEFTLASAGTCGANPNLSIGQSCTVNITFSPRFPGLRHAAVVLETSGGQLVASTLISGTGQGGLPVLVPGQINTVAGDGQWFYQGDNVPATQAPIYLPSALAVDGAGNLYFADTINNRIRRVDAVTYNITTVAGDGSAGTGGDGGPATSADLTSPSGLALDGAGNLYIADTGNNAIRRVDAVSNFITTVAGSLGHAGYTGDGGPAVAALLNAPQGLAITASGDLVIADTTNNVVRVVTASDSHIQTIAGSGTAGYNGDGILATNAQLNQPSDVALRADGAIAIADLGNNRVRLMTAGGNISTFAGNGTLGYAGDNGPATQAEIQGPAAVTFDPAGDLIIADSVNNCIRLVYGPQNTIITISGTPTDDSYAGDGGPANQAHMHGPDGVFFDAQGDLWFSDRFNNRVREISGSLLTIGPYPTIKVGKTSQPVAEAMINAGNQPLNLSSPVLQQAALDSTTTTCGQAPLSSSTFCNMGVEFAPTSVGPTINGSISWTSDAPNVTPVDQVYGQVLSIEPTTTAITSNANPGLLGQPVTLTTTVTTAATSITGTVNFVEGGNTWCSGVQLSAAGTATCQISSLALGNHSFVANYSGDNNNAASQSPAFAETIKQQAALALGISTNPAVVTNNVTLTISAADAYGTPTGTVIFYDGATALATVTLDGNGNASWSTSSLAVGTHTLTAQYSGDSSNIAGTSSAKTLLMNQATTTTVLSSGNNNATVGSNVTLSASVASTNGPNPTGSVQFFDGSVNLGSSTIAGNGASITSNTLAPGSHTLTAVYSGDTDNASSTSAAFTLIVQQIGTVTTISADADPLNAGATLHLTAITSMNSGATADGSLSGTITFEDGRTVLGTAPINGVGQATLAVNSLAVGAHPMVASFGGNINYAPSSSAALNETVQQTSTATTLSAVSSSTLTGKPASFTVTLTSSTGTPTGTVTFRDGNTVLGTSPLSFGNATYSTTTLNTGTHAITALYSGDNNYLASSSAALQQTVSLAQTTVVLSGPASAVDAGTPAHFQALLATPGITPTGTLTLLDGSVTVGAAPILNAGSFAFTTAQLAVGVHHLTVSYSGDGNNAAVISAAVTVTVQQAATVTALTSSANPLTQGGALALTATVTSDSPSPGNQVSFFEGANLLGSVALNANGTATFSPQNLALGSHNLTAVYSGDTNHAGSAATVLPELVLQASSVSLTSSVEPSVSGQSVSLMAQVLGSPTPTGTVLFRDNGAAIATVSLNATGLATLSTSALAVGSHTISVTYSGDTNFASTGAQLTQSVLNATTQATFAANVNPATYGQPTTLSAAVSSNGGAATGTVTFTDAGVVIGSAQLDAHGNASLTLSTLAPSTHALAANYLGDGKASACSSAVFDLTVKQTTALALSSNANPAQTLTSVNLVASLTNAGAATATGTVVFTDGAANVGTATLDGTGHATLTVPQFTAGTHSITAAYAGDAVDFSSQSAALSQFVQLRPTSTAVTGTETDTANPQQVTLIAVVHGGGSTPPSGLVTFTSGTLTLGAASVDETGVATITVIFNSATQQIVASYVGDVSYSRSQSSSTSITAGTPPQFTIALSAPSITLQTHQHTTVSVTVTSVKGFNDTIQLGCLGLPYAATCSFDQSQVKLAADGTARASVVLDTGDPLGAGSSATASVSGERNTLLCFLPACLLLGGLVRRDRGGRRSTAHPYLLAALFGIMLATGLTGCSGLQMSGTPPGTYTVTIIGTGQGSNATESQPINLVVTQ